MDGGDKVFRILMTLVMAMALLTPAGFAAGPNLVDANPDYGVLVSLDEWYAGRPVPAT